jgi:hypothetical protein
MTAQLARRLNESNITVMFTQTASRTNLTSTLQTLRVGTFGGKLLMSIGSLQEKKARIVFVNFDTSLRSRFFCEVYRTFSRQLRERYVWILTENDYHLWDLTIDNCTRSEILDAARGHIIIDSSYQRRPSLINPKRVGEKRRTTVETCVSFQTAYELQQGLKKDDPLHRQILHAYDVIWVIALLIHASIAEKYSFSKGELFPSFTDNVSFYDSIPIEQFTYTTTSIRDRWLTLVDDIHFLGVSVS